MKRLAFALLLLPSLASADGIAYRVGKGVQVTPTAAAPTKGSGNALLWVDSTASNVLKYKNPAGVTVTLGAGTGSYNQTIEDEGVAVTQRSNLNFVGAGVSCADSGGKTVCTISSGGSTGNWTFTGDAADDSGAAVLTIGATTATGVTLSRTAGTITMAGDTVFSANKGVTVTAGTSSFNFSGGTGTFLTSSGANTLSGTTTLAASKNFVYAAGTGTFDGSASSGAFTTSTGTNTLSGNVVISGAKTFTTGTGQASINGDLQMASGKHIYGGASTSAADFSAGSGIFKTTTGAATFGGSSNTFTNDVIITQTAATSGANTPLTITGAADTGLANGALLTTDLLVDGQRTVSFVAGGVNALQGTYFRAPTYDFASASTVTTAATVAIDNHPSTGANATFTNQWALHVVAGRTYLGGGLVTATVGATAATGHTVPNITADTFALLAAAQTFTNKTITSPTISGPTLSGSVTGTYNIAGTPTATSPILANLGATTVAPTWTALTYSNSWVDYGTGGYAASGWTKSATGLVQVRVYAKNGTASTAIATLPAGSRPGSSMIIPGTGRAAGTYGILLVTTAGVMTPGQAGNDGEFYEFSFFAEN